MDASTFWWLLTGLAVAAELLTGTFYLLMLALGLAAGAVCAHLGLAQATQVVVAAFIGATAVLGWHRTHPAPSKQKTEHNPDLHLDIGSTVDVIKWTSPQATLVMHRGAEWSARPVQHGLSEDTLPSTGLHRIVAVNGNTLVLSKI
jgi:membrane protein implicated in regulation of membrane protease activity